MYGVYQGLRNFSFRKISRMYQIDDPEATFCLKNFSKYHALDQCFLNWSFFGRQWFHSKCLKKLKRSFTCFSFDMKIILKNSILLKYQEDTKMMR